MRPSRSMGCVLAWIQVLQERNSWRNFLNTAMKLGFRKMWECLGKLGKLCSFLRIQVVILIFVVEKN
jgi:hypothetical protein